MKKSVFIILSILLLTSSTFISFAAEEFTHGMGALKSYFCNLEDRPTAGAGDLRYFITKCGSYTEWKLWPGKEKFYEGKEPHGALLTVYVNKVALDSIEVNKGMLSGSIIVKENYSSEKKLMAITAMYKVEGYNPEGGDWFWVKYDPEFKVVEEGKVKGCLDCHSKAKDNDYINTGKVK